MTHAPSTHGWVKVLRKVLEAAERLPQADIWMWAVQQDAENGLGCTRIVYHLETIAIQQ